MADSDKLDRKLDRILYGQAEIMLHLQKKEATPEAIAAEQKRLREAFDSKPAQQMEGPGIRIIGE